MSAAVQQAGAVPAPRRAPEADRIAVRDFLFEEARVLDESDPRRWPTMLTADVRYRMPTRPSLYELDRGRLSADRMALYDDDRTMLERRVVRMTHPTAWSENPSTRVVRQVSNVEVFLSDQPGEFLAYSVIAVYRNRNEADQDLVFARRSDLIRRDGDRLLLARREIAISQNTLLGKNLNVFL